jgi:hypothetical protein
MTPNALELDMHIVLKSLQKHCQMVFSRFLATTRGNFPDFFKEASLITALKSIVNFKDFFANVGCIWPRIVFMHARI